MRIVTASGLHLGFRVELGLMLYHLFIHIDLLRVCLNLLRHLVMLLGLLSHFVFELFQVLLHQVILIINDRLIAINLLLQLLELQSVFRRMIL